MPNLRTRTLFPGEAWLARRYAREQADTARRAADDPDAAVFARLVFFCDTADARGTFAFDPGDVTDPATGDMRVYRVDCKCDPGRRYGGRIKAFAPGFAEFLLRHVFADEFRWGDPRLGPPPQSVGRSGGEPEPFITLTAIGLW